MERGASKEFHIETPRMVAIIFVCVANKFLGKNVFPLVRMAVLLKALLFYSVHFLFVFFVVFGFSSVYLSFLLYAFLPKAKN